MAYANELTDIIKVYVRRTTTIGGYDFPGVVWDYVSLADPSCCNTNWLCLPGNKKSCSDWIYLRPDIAFYVLEKDLNKNQVVSEGVRFVHWFPTEHSVKAHCSVIRSLKLSGVRAQIIDSERDRELFYRTGEFHTSELSERARHYYDPVSATGFPIFSEIGRGIYDYDLET